MGSKNNKPTIIIEKNTGQINITMDKSVINATLNRGEISYKENNDMFRIFMSSTYADLIDYRKSAEQAINDLGYKYEGMEYMGAEDKESSIACFDVIDRSDLFVGIYAWRYGYIPEGYEKSITELEYDYAVKKGIPCLCYFLDEDYPWKPSLIENSAKEKLQNFKDRILKDRVIKKFTDLASLKYNINNDIGKWIKENTTNNKVNNNKTTNESCDDNCLIDRYKKAVIDKYEILSTLGELKENFDMESIYIPLTIHVDCEVKFNGIQSDKMLSKFSEKSMTAETLINLDNPVSVVLGKPGMGKTTMLKFLALKESKKSDGLVPVYIRLSDFSKVSISLEDYLINEFFSDTNIIRKAIKDNKLLIFLDGLDEVSTENYSIVTKQIRDFIAYNKLTRVIITSRNAGFQNNQLPYFTFEIDELPVEQIEKYIDKFFNESKQDLKTCIKDNESIMNLAKNPFLLSIICFVYKKDKSLPKRRVELYEKCTETLLSLYNAKKVEKIDKYSSVVKEDVMGDIAYKFFCKGIDEFPAKQLKRQVFETLKRLDWTINEDSIINEICENSGILQNSENKYLFVHRTFFEYYVAYKFMNTNDFKIKILEYANETTWEEPIRLYSALIDNEIEGTEFLKELWKKNKELSIKCFDDMRDVIDVNFIKEMLISGGKNERNQILKGLPEKVEKFEVFIDTFEELFKLETNGECIYWIVDILENKIGTEYAKQIVYEKLDKGAKDRYKKYAKKDMVKIPAGRFMMGSKDGEVYFNDEEPLHEVELDKFFMSKYTVTNTLYEVFDPSHNDMRNEYSNGDKQPAIYVNWYEATMFCRWLGCRLPTEAQWEYACRAGTETKYNFGDEITIKEANFNDNYKLSEFKEKEYFESIKGRKTSDVDDYKPNKWGLYNMHGNVYEWCNDWYDESYYKECNEKVIIKDPIGSENGSGRVVRGGSWGDFADDCRSADRGWRSPGRRGDGVSLRLVFVP